MSDPKTNGSNGRDKKGKFAPGNGFGSGGSYAATQKRKLQSVLLKATTEARLKKVVDALFKAAEQGESWAVKEVLDRMLGKAPQSLDVSGNLSMNVADFFMQAAERVRTRSIN